MIFMNSSSIQRTALLWDESFLWGLMAHQAFSSSRIPFDLVTSGEVREGALDAYSALFIPGGWAGDKYRALGEKGREKIVKFVRRGGAYVGFCGGAGLALDVKEGLALVPVKRVPTRDRMPNFSGRITMVPVEEEHPIWKGLEKPASFYAWWPGQFSLEDDCDVKVVANYGEPGEDFYVADLFLDDAKSSSLDWSKWEEVYGIHMDPEKLLGEPAILEADCGEGKIFLSYLHLDTPGDPPGLQALKNLFSWLLPDEIKNREESQTKTPTTEKLKVEDEMLDLLADIDHAADDLILFGERNYLWYWRTPYLLQWRRGIRGMEYGIIRVLCREIYKRLRELRASGKSLVIEEESDLMKELGQIRKQAREFVDKAKLLLMKERFAMNDGVLHHLKNHEDVEIQGLREYLFSGSKRFGGLFKELLDRLDRVLLITLRS